MVLSQGAKLTRLSPIQRKGFMSMGASRQPTRNLVHSHSFLTWELGNLGNPDSCANGDLHTVSRGTIIGGTGRYAGARGSLTTDRCVNLATGESSGTISGT